MKTIEQLLVEDAAREVADDGFSVRVLAALPRPVHRRAWWKPVLMLGSTALGCLLAALFAPAGASVTQGIVDLATRQYLTPGALALFGCALTLAISAAVLAADGD